MKRTIQIFGTLLLLAAATLPTGCKKDSAESAAPANGVITLTNNIPPIFEAEGGQTTVTFNSTAAWSAEVDQSWASVTPSEGQAGNVSVTLHAEPNDSGSERNATLILHSGTGTARLVFYQKQENALTVTSNRYEVERQGRDITVEVQANVTFEYEIDEAAEEWIEELDTRAMTTTLLHFRIYPNDTPGKREGRITLRSSDRTEVVTVYQEGEEPEIILSESTPTMGSDGGTLTVEVRSNLTCEVQLPDAPDWLREKATRTMSTYTYHFEVDPNEGYDNRTTRIVFHNAEFGVSQTVTVTQMQRNAILVAEERYTLDAAAGTLNLPVNTNVDFEVTTSEDWIRQTTSTRALEERTLRFTFDANTGDAPREAQIRLTADGVEQTIRVYQAGRDGESRLGIVHTKQTFTIPFFSGSSTLLYGTVTWGDGSQEEYTEEASHTYQSGSTHTVTLEMAGADSFTLPDLVGITELDLSEF